MPREKKDYRNFNIKLATPVYEMLEQFCEENGITKTAATEKIMSKYLEDYFKKKKTERILF